MLLIGKERGERVGGRERGFGFAGGGKGKLLRSEKPIDEADDIRQVGPPDGTANIVGESFEGSLVFGGITPYGGGQVLVSEMEDGETDVLCLLCDVRTDTSATQSHLTST